MPENSQLKGFANNLVSNIAFEILKGIGGLTLVKGLWVIIKNEYYRSLVDWWFVLVCLVVGGSLITIAYYFQTKQSANVPDPAPQSQPPAVQESPIQTNGIVPGIPTVSSLLGMESTVDFDAKKFFAFAHYSTITAEIEKNFKIIAQQNSPNDKEAFYARFIGVGVAAYHYEVSWLLIFSSQLSAMAEMNRRGVIPTSDLKQYYDKGAQSNPAFYANYKFEQWLSFLKEKMLVVVYPSHMVEITWLGKDFLKYIAHTAKRVEAKKN